LVSKYLDKSSLVTVFEGMALPHPEILNIYIS
jgi:hypothetical protein